MHYWQFWASYWKGWTDLMGVDANPVNSSENIPNEDIERVRSEFISNVNHDLRTPLNAVIGFAQIIENEMLGKVENPQYLEYARHIQESGYELLNRIEELCGGAASTQRVLPFRKRARTTKPRTRPKSVRHKKQLVAAE